MEVWIDKPRIKYQGTWDDKGETLNFKVKGKAQPKFIVKFHCITGVVLIPGADSLSWSNTE